MKEINPDDFRVRPGKNVDLERWPASRKETPELEPLASIGHPPTHAANGNSCPERPPDRQNEISRQTEKRESDPEDFAFHGPIYSANSPMRRSYWALASGSKMSSVVI